MTEQEEIEKVFLLNEIGTFTKQAQEGLKDVIEKFSKNNRFILIGNDISKLDQAIKSRCQNIVLKTHSPEKLMEHFTIILSSEGIDFDFDTLEEHISLYSPDMRGIFNSIESSIAADDKLLKPDAPTEENDDDTNWWFDLIEAADKGDIARAKKIAFNASLNDGLTEWSRLVLKYIHYFSGSELKIIDELRSFQNDRTYAVTKSDRALLLISSAGRIAQILK